MNQRTAELAQPLLRYFGIAESCAGLHSLDHERELLGQLDGNSWTDSTTATGEGGLFLGCPLSNDRRELTSDCLLWCPQGWPAGRFTSLASSRLGDRLISDSRVADAIRNFFVLLDDADVVVIGQGTTLDPPATRGCRLFDRNCLRLLPFPKTITKTWIRESLQSREAHTTCVWFDSGIMSVDEVAFAICDQVRVIHTRAGGRMAALLDRYTASEPGPMILKLVDDESSSQNEIGPVGWHLFNTTSSREASPRIDSFHEPTMTLGAWTSEFLNHWTRAERQPWPDQTKLSQFDLLFLGEQQKRHGVLDSLCRILVQRRLLASGRLVRGGQRVVCFTEVPLQEFPERRVFRPQLSRWDFEPWGISIRRSVIEGLGGQPVEYVANVDPAATLSPLLVANSANSKVDWSAELEWRVIGDIDLRKIRSKDAVVFVPDRKAARVVSRLSRWPVVVLTTPESPGS